MPGYQGVAKFASSASVTLASTQLGNRLGMELRQQSKKLSLRSPNIGWWLWDIVLEAHWLRLQLITSVH